jgi:hypothetical protein
MIYHEGEKIGKRGGAFRDYVWPKENLHGR